MAMLAVARAAATSGGRVKGGAVAPAHLSEAGL